MERTRLRTAILFDEARVYSADMSAEQAFEIDSAEYLQDFAILRGEEGFNIRTGQTDIQEQRVYEVQRKGRGWLHNPFKKEQPTNPTEPQR